MNTTSAATTTAVAALPAPPAGPPASADVAPAAIAPAAPATAPTDGLGAEVRESVLLLGLSVTVTAGLAVAAQSLLSLLS